MPSERWLTWAVIGITLLAFWYMLVLVVRYINEIAIQL